MTQSDTDTGTIANAELLLPWYVAGTLSAEETAEVEAWLKDNPEAEAHLIRAREEMDVTIGSSEALGMPRAAAFDDLMARIGPVNQPANSVSFVDRILEFLSPKIAIGVTAALALVVVGQGIAINNLMTTTPVGQFEVASGGDAAANADALTALVAFQPGVSLGEISAYLTEQQIRIVDGPKPGGIYQIAAANDEDGQAALDQLAEDESLVMFFAKNAQ